MLENYIRAPAQSGVGWGRVVRRGCAARDGSNGSVWSLREEERGERRGGSGACVVERYSGAARDCSSRAGACVKECAVSGGGGGDACGGATRRRAVAACV